jgi:hypothetical protein
MCIPGNAGADNRTRLKFLPAPLEGFPAMFLDHELDSKLSKRECRITRWHHSDIRHNTRNGTLSRAFAFTGIRQANLRPAPQKAAGKAGPRANGWFAKN